MKKIFLVIFSVLMLSSSFSQAKTESTSAAFKKIVQAQPHTFFCHLPIGSDLKVSFQSCGHCPIEQLSVVSMPVVPFEWLAKNLPCYEHKLCAKSNGPFYKGLVCCKKTDIFYQRMSQDLHNWVPETKYIKQLRGQNTPAVLPNVPFSLGCHELVVDKKKHLIHIPERQRGAFARIYLYMADAYQLTLEKELRMLLTSWHALYPVSAWEKERNRLIYQAQGSYNKWVEIF